MFASMSTRFTLAFQAASPVSIRAVSNPLTHLRRHTPRCQPNRLIVSANTSSQPSPPLDSKRRVVFLGTPQVAANTLQTLYEASQTDTSTFDITAVVTQPPAPVGRKRQLTKSPVHQFAESLSISPIFTPASASDTAFLSDIEDIRPHACITAAYGNFLPSRFLIIPTFGTLNIHPSLLPAFRGAAPVPRALQAGVEETGVSILVTVLKMDAGPIITKRIRKLDGNERAPELLTELFSTGTQALLDVLPQVWDKSYTSEIQDDALASHAPKIKKEEARVSFTENAVFVHNAVRAFAGWPGSWADFVLVRSSESEVIRLKIGKTVVLKAEGGVCFDIHQISFDDSANCLVVTCGDGSQIGLLEVQPPGKKVMDARSFWNGLRDRTLERKRLAH